MAETIWSILISTGIVTVLIVLAGMVLKSALREWLLTRIRSSIQLKLDTELETHKAKLAGQVEEEKLRLSNELGTHKALLETVRASFSEGQRASMDRKLAAVDIIWSEVLILRRLTLSKMTYVDVFKETETHKYKEVMESNLGNTVLQESSLEEKKERLNTISHDLDKVRPYIGEYLWGVLECYRAIQVRMFFVLEMFSDDSSKVIGWYRDEGTYGIVTAVLNETELEHFDNMQFGKFTWLIGKVETKMLAELRHIVSGQHFAQDALGKIDDDALEEMRQAVASARENPW